LEAWSIILPEHYGVELVDVIDGIDRYAILLPTMYSGIAWRAIKSFTNHSRRLIMQGLRNPDSFDSAIDALLGVAVIPEHPLNGDFLDQLVRGQELTSRDSWWSTYLHFDYVNKMSGYRLIEWSLKADLMNFTEDTDKLWAKTLAWFCSTSDRRVRDRATKGLVRVLLSKPRIASDILAMFLNVDDDYILERVSLACYSVALLTDDEQCLTQLCDVLYERVFSTHNVPHNALVRDWLRFIMERALDLGILGDNRDPKISRPPYQSAWPIHFPHPNDIEHLSQREAFQREMNLDSYGIGTDFARYILEPKLLRRYDIDSLGITSTQVHAWFMKSAAEDLGYPGEGERCFEYDQHLLWTYGGGRSKPTWAERLGKKYYWILLQRLAGIFGDHVPLKHDHWDSDDAETSLPRLQGVRLRDIDPTDLRDLSTRPMEQIDWWIPFSYDFSSSSDVSDVEWVTRVDFPNPQESLEVIDFDNACWIHLYLSYDLKSAPSSSRHMSYPYRKIDTLVHAVTVPLESLNNVEQQIAGRRFEPDFIQFQADNYRIFLGEYPNSLACMQSFETNELWVKCSIPGVEQSENTTISLLRGAEFEYDCSSETETPHLQVPAPDFINHGDLTWDGQSGWRDEDGHLQIVNVRSDLGAGVIIRKSYLQNYLAERSLALIVIGIQEKMVVTGGIGGSGIHGMRYVLSFDGQRIQQVDQFDYL